MTEEQNKAQVSEKYLRRPYLCQKRILHKINVAFGFCRGKSVTKLAKFYKVTPKTIRLILHEMCEAVGLDRKTDIRTLGKCRISFEGLLKQYHKKVKLANIRYIQMVRKCPHCRTVLSKTFRYNRYHAAYLRGWRKRKKEEKNGRENMDHAPGTPVPEQSGAPHEGRKRGRPPGRRRSVPRN
jgi:hypothetical protein